MTMNQHNVPPRTHNKRRADVRRMAMWVRSHIPPGSSFEWCGARFYHEHSGKVQITSPGIFRDTRFNRDMAAAMAGYLGGGSSKHYQPETRREIADNARQFGRVALPM